jgi:adenylate cyclase
MRLYCGSQQLGAAIKQFEVCRSALQEELGIDPGPETQRLIRQLDLQNRPSPDSSPDAAESEPARDTPSLVVLPIVNLAGVPELDYLADGVTDEITTELTRYHSLFVISRESAFASEVGPEGASISCRRFGVRYALRGSLRRSGRGFRINLRLVEGGSGQNVWGERYDLSQEELLDLPPEVAGQVVARLAAWLERDALARAHRKPAKDWSAYDHILQGLEYHHRNWYGIHNTLRAIQHFERAVEIDPDSARAYAYLACAKSYPWFKDRRHERLDPCMDLARRAVELDPTEAEAHRILGGVHLVRAEHEPSRFHFEEAQRVNPGHAHVLAHAARYHMHSSDPRKAAGLLSQARRLNPLHPPWYWEHVGINAFVKRDYEAALTAFSRMQSHSFYDQLYATAANAHLGRKRHAAHHLALVLEKRPRLRLSKVPYFLPYRNQTDLDHVLEGLGKAGLPN